jgi:MFS family permease
MLISEAAASVVCAPVLEYLFGRSETRRRLYTPGLLLLLISMALFASAFSIACYLAARVLQGVATAMVAVSIFSIITDTVQEAHLVYMLGYIDVGLRLGFVSGPSIGGIIYHIAGYYTVCGIAFSLIGINLVLRLAAIESKAVVNWFEPEENDRTPEPVLPTPCLHYGAIQKSNESLASDSRMFAFWTLLQQPRILITTWAFISQSLLNFALHSVSLPSAEYVCRVLADIKLDRRFPFSRWTHSIGTPRVLG